MSAVRTNQFNFRLWQGDQSWR